MMCVCAATAIQTATRGGIPSSRYDALRRDIVQTYGYACVHDIGALEAAVSGAHDLTHDTSLCLFCCLHGG
jgi:hypothetical protein